MNMMNRFPIVAVRALLGVALPLVLGRRAARFATLNFVTAHHPSGYRPIIHILPASHEIRQPQLEESYATQSHLVSKPIS